MLSTYHKLSLFTSLIAAICTTLAIVQNSDILGFLSGIFWIISVLFDYHASKSAGVRLRRLEHQSGISNNNKKKKE